jgi:hypothetical protein
MGDNMKIVAVIALLVVSLSARADLPKEMYMANDAGGFVVLTVEPCAFANVSKEYPYKAYATESSDAVYHAGCWTSPDTSEVPTELYSKSEGAGTPPTIRVIRMVNTWWEEGATATFLQSNFTPEKKRLK